MDGFRKPWLAGIAVALLLGVGLWSNGSWGSNAHALTNCDVSSSQVALDSAEQELRALINNHRVANGRAALTIDSRLNRAAQWLTNDWAAYGYSGHTDSHGRGPGTRSLGCGAPSAAGGEIAGSPGTLSPTTIFTMWKDSTKGHNTTMLNPNWVSFGIGKNSSGGWAVDFSSAPGDGITGSPSSPPTTAPPTGTPQATNPPASTDTPRPTNTPRPTSTPKSGVTGTTNWQYQSIAPGLSRE